MTVNISNDIFERFSSLSKLTRIVAYCLRFCDNCKVQPTERKGGHLTSQELQVSMSTLIKLVQKQYFSEDIQTLKSNNQVSSKSHLKSLNPFIDNQNLVRVGGRLSHSQGSSYNYKHPIVLPSKHYFTKLLIIHEHIRNLHAGVQGTLSAIRQKFWPLNGRQTVRSVLRNCITCFRHNPNSLNPQMGNLPTERVTPSRIFSTCGVDYAGPYQIKDSKFRNRKIIKGYICAFVCLATKAVHLELVTELSTDGFLNALQRFVARRGICTKIISDNATNFVGANNELKEIERAIQSEKMSHYLSNNHIEWKFIPARSPHMGGLWESVIKSTKYHLNRILNNLTLTYEQFYTLLTQIEAVLNSRPLVPLSSDPNDLESITPGHFIIGEALTNIPQTSITENLKVNHVTRYKHLQQLTHQFWNKWSRNYLHQLQERTKWRFNKPGPNLVGSLVYMKDERTPPLLWPVGRIVETHPGSDGIIRVATVRTKSGLTKRAITRLCLLPIEQFSNHQNAGTKLK